MPTGGLIFPVPERFPGAAGILLKAATPLSASGLSPLTEDRSPGKRFHSDLFETLSSLKSVYPSYSLLFLPGMVKPFALNVNKLTGFRSDDAI